MIIRLKWQQSKQRVRAWACCHVHDSCNIKRWEPRQLIIKAMFKKKCTNDAAGMSDWAATNRPLQRHLAAALRRLQPRCELAASVGTAAIRGAVPQCGQVTASVSYRNPLAVRVQWEAQTKRPALWKNPLKMGDPTTTGIDMVLYSWSTHVVVCLPSGSVLLDPRNLNHQEKNQSLIDFRLRCTSVDFATIWLLFPVIYFQNKSPSCWSSCQAALKKS